MKNILSALCKINYKETPTTCISKQIIWNNSYIKCDNNIIYYKERHEKGIKYIEHIYDYRSNTFYNFDNLQNLYDLNTTVVMDVTMGTGTFKPEKNLEFFRPKSPGTHR